jgi:hypothetical protein
MSTRMGTRTTLGWLPDHVLTVLAVPLALGWHPDHVPIVLVVPLALGAVVVGAGCRTG